MYFGPTQHNEYSRLFVLAELVLSTINSAINSY